MEKSDAKTWLHWRRETSNGGEVIVTTTTPPMLVYVLPKGQKWLPMFDSIVKAHNTLLDECIRAMSDDEYLGSRL